MSACDEVALHAKSGPRPIEDERHAREDGSAGREAGAGELHLREELREEVADLRPCDEQRMAGLRPLRADEKRVRGRTPAAASGAPVEAAVVEHDAPRRRRGRDSAAGTSPGTLDGRLGIVRLAQVREDAPRVGRAEPSSSASRNIAFCTSWPPFVPKRAAMSAADATTSLAVNGVAGIPFARY